MRKKAYKVSFLKNLFSSTGTPFKCLQGAVTVKSQSPDDAVMRPRNNSNVTGHLMTGDFTPTKSRRLSATFSACHGIQAPTP